MEKENITIDDPNVRYRMSIGVPIKLLHEAEGHTVTIELKTGEVYRGFLVESEDNMNCQLSNISYTARDGRMSELEHAFIRGSKIRFLILPDMLKNAPMFKKVDPKAKKGVGLGRGRAAILKRGMNMHNYGNN
jgi:small nuclear ribonucleoprotein D3